MKQSALIASSLLLLLGAGCSQEGTEYEDADEQDILREVPTVSEASASAAADVNADNADQTLEEIRKELDDGR